MSDNPLEDSPERDAMIREKAYHLWEAEGRPDGRDNDFWERASDLVGMQQSAGSGQLANPVTQDNPMPRMIVEEASIQENLGEFPDRLSDQGEFRQTPMTKEALRSSEKDAS